MEYDVALSFAGEDRDYVLRVASHLKNAGIRVYYDEFEEIKLWGKDLYVYFRDIYTEKAKYTVMFISEHYAKKVWTNHERESAQARALQENREYILPARFDRTKIPGLLDTTGYIPLTSVTSEEFAEKIIQKLKLSITESGTKQIRYTDEELSDRALKIVAEVRKLLANYRRSSNEVTLGRRYSPNQTEEERSTEWHEMTTNLQNLTTDLMTEYDSGHKVDAILLKNELVHRLPQQNRVEHTDVMYQHPTNPLGIESVMSDLEALARSLV